ncbi:type-F conjugative transfer system secretin TraK [Escherichia coli]
MRVYQVPLNIQRVRAGSVSSPGALRPCAPCARGSNRTPYLLVQACQHLWPVIAVNSLDGALTNNEQTASGGVVVATVNKKPFTFILETERGLNLSIQAVPREGAGRTIQLVSDLRGTGEEAGAWETSTPYESLLVTISQAVRGGKLPAGWYQVPVTKETLQAPAGLSSVADVVWTGNHLKMVRFTVENKTLSALNIRESDFWQPGTRAVMFSQPASQLLAGARMDVYVIRDGEGN